MASTTTNPDAPTMPFFDKGGVPAWPKGERRDLLGFDDAAPEKQSHSALQALLAFSALHEQVRRRKTLAAQHAGFDGQSNPEFEDVEQFVLDDVLQLVAERAVSITGADGLAIALAENNEIVLRAAAGKVRPDIGTRIDRDSAFSGACFRNAEIVNCDDTETDERVNLKACRIMGARSMVAVPLCGRRRVIGVLEAFSTWPFGFNDSDIRNLSLLAELVLGALKPEDEDRFAESAQAAATELEPAVRSARGAVEKDIPPIVPVPRTTAADEFIAPDVATEREIAPRAWPRSESETEAPVMEAAGEKEDSNQSTGETSSQRSGILILLICIVVSAAFGAGMWWKLRTAQLNDAIVHPQNQVLQGGKKSSIGTAGTKKDSANSESESEALPNVEASSAASPQQVGKFPKITGIRHWSSAESSTVVIDLEDQVQYEAHRLTGPDRIYFDLRDTQLSADLSGKIIDVGDPLLGRIRAAQPVAGMTRIVLETKANTNFSVSLEPNPYRLMVELRPIGTSARGTTNLFPDAAQPDKSAMAIVVPPAGKEDLQLRARVGKMRIAVDAGHGGWDLGTVGKRGLLEKDVVLEVAQRLGKLLESRLGAEVIYTRQNDNYIPLDERAGIANQAQADFFVSVHANYSDLPSARGVETYYTNSFSSAGTSKDADAHAALTNAKATMPAMLSATDLHDRIEQSRRLAASVQRSLYGALSLQNPGLKDRGVKEAGFVVLTESSMPGILAEVSFVSSPADEQRLRSDGYREQIAEALYKGIARYAAASHSVKVAAR
jgi:N-acetylmuramoyl-L-alanine amidase/putative methionine-R-sulfoxide reductase with GAF domain